MTKKSFLLLLLLAYYQFISFIQISYRSRLLETKGQTTILKFFIYFFILIELFCITAVVDLFEMGYIRLGFLRSCQ